MQEWVTYSRQHYIKAYAADFPRLLFQDGISSITDISVGTKVGILFAIVIAALTKDGKEVLLSDKKMNNRTYLNMIEIFELLLCYWAWLKKEEYWDIHDTEALQCAKTSIFETVNKLKRLFPRLAGEAWKIPKFHEQLHIAFIYGCMEVI